MIEFDDVVDDDESPDEDLPQPPERPATTRRRLLGAGVAVLALAGLITYARVSGGGDDRPAARSAAPSESPPSRIVVAPRPSDGGGLLVEHVGDRNGTLRNDVEITVPARLVPPPCPQSDDGFASCVVRTTVNRSSLDAIRHRLPAAHPGTTSTATLRATDAGSVPGLWYRVYRASLPAGSLTVLVSRHEAAPSVEPTSIVFGADTVVYLRHVTGRYDVQVQVKVRRGHAPSSATLAALAADARLVAD